MKIWILSLLCVAGLFAAERPNVLFIAIDDMNDWVGFLDGHPQAHTPNMDRLAQAGVNFTNAHCVSPACSPSRNALLYGVEPFHSGLYPFYEHDDLDPSVLAKYVSLPQFFKDNGYGTFGSGKIHHGSKGRANEWTQYHHAASKNLIYKPEAGYQIGDSHKMAFCPTTSPFEDHHDHKVASYGIDVLTRKHDKPFFLAVGIVKPHLAFVCPEKFFDDSPQQITPPPIKEDDLDDVPKIGRTMAKKSDDERYRQDKAWNDVRRSYTACIRWVDYNVGRVLDALEKSAYADNTIVLLWSDHGYHMGEKRSFRKFSLWEEATKVPFVIHDRRPASRTQGICNQPVSLINVYRTLADMTGLQPAAYVDGTSLVPQLKNPTAKVNGPAITTWGRGNYGIRSEHWRYIRYFDGGEELYNHKTDSNEWNNLAGNPEYAGKIAELAAHLPKKEAPLVTKGIGLYNVVDADKAAYRKTTSTTQKTKKNKKIGKKK